MTNFIFNFILLRLKQGYRILIEQGFYAIPMLLLLCLLILFSYKTLNSLNSLWVQIIIALTFCTIDQNRKDQKFIQHLKENGKYVILIEYLILLLFFDMPFLLKKPLDYYMLIPLSIISLLIASKNAIIVGAFSSKFGFIESVTSVIEINAFEWRTGIRKHSFFFFSSYVIGIILLFFYPITPIFMLYWLTFSGEFYNTLENKEIIQAYQTINNFKQKKMQSFFVTINLIFMPHYIIFVSLYMDWHMIFLFLSIVIFNLVFFFALLFKYTKINDKNKRDISNTLPITIFSIIAIFLPLSVYNIFSSWKISKINLKPYLK